jgi:MerR family transcriptional regulator, light-induced transcriptional regulator
MAGSRAPQSAAHAFGSASSAESPGWCDGFARCDTDTSGGSSPEKLALIIEQEIVPRLMLMHQMREQPAVKRRRSKAAIGPRILETFTKLITADDADAVKAFIADRIERGASGSSLCLELLAPTARRLGELWESDAVDFVTVTIAIKRLHALLNLLRAPPAVEPGFGGRFVLLTPVPGDDHSFGLAIVAEFFRASGWHVTGSGLLARHEISAAIETRSFSAIGFSLGSEVLRDELTALIDNVRRRSLNPKIAVLVGGPIFAVHPDWVRQVGADAYAADAKAAVAVAEQLHERQNVVPTGHA